MASEFSSSELKRMQALDHLLEQALSLEAAQRETFLRSVQARDPEVAVQLKQLLSAAQREDPLLDGVHWGRLATEYAHCHHAGERIGNYRLQRQLGVGGMGEVWLAQLESAELPAVDVGLATAATADKQVAAVPVALKLIRSTLSRAVLGERLRRERDILMRLSHPGIARLLDSGISSEGEPYLVLEYVQGQPLLDYAAQLKLDLRGRLQLFAQICAAVAAAQARLIVHRDIKPQNVLVTADGQAKLLDFGIAKLLHDSHLGSSSELTKQLGSALTPAYAAPEQLRAEPVTTATDVYSLGVLLHELLLGQRPQRAGPQADLTQPSRLARRGARAVGLDLREQALRGDLDCLLQRALADAPTARYASAQALANDVEAWLAARPLQARPDTLRYRVGKLLARHPFASASVTAALAAVLLASAVAWQQSRVAQREAARAAYVHSFLEALFSNDLPGAPRDQLPTTAELLRRGSAQALADDGAEPGARLALLLALARIQLAQREFEGAKLSLQTAATILPAVSDAPRWQQAAIAAELADINPRQLPGQRQQGVEALRVAIAQAQSQNAPAEWLAGALSNLANSQIDLDQGEAARRSVQQAMALLARTPEAKVSLRLSVLTQAVAAHTFDQQFRPIAEDYARSALALAEQNFAPQHAEIAYASMRLALVLRIKGDLQAAQTEVQRAVDIARVAYPENHPQLARILEEAARIALRLNQPEKGVALWREVLAIRRVQLGQTATAEDDYAVLRTEAFLASALLRVADFEQAAALALHAQRGLGRSVGSVHPLWLDVTSYAAKALIELNRAAEARQILPLPDAAVPAEITPTTRWRFLELQLIASTLAAPSERVTALTAVIARINAESVAPKENALLLLNAAAAALDLQASALAQEALNASERRLAGNDPTHLMEIHRLLSLLAANKIDAAAVRAARDVVQQRRGGLHFAVRVADHWLAQSPKL